MKWLSALIKRPSAWPAVGFDWKWLGPPASLPRPTRTSLFWPFSLQSFSSQGKALSQRARDELVEAVACAMAPNARDEIAEAVL